MYKRQVQRPLAGAIIVIIHGPDNSLAGLPLSRARGHAFCHSSDRRPLTSSLRALLRCADPIEWEAIASNAYRPGALVKGHGVKSPRRRGLLFARRLLFFGELNREKNAGASLGD